MYDFFWSILIGCKLIFFTCSGGLSLDDTLHGYASLSLVRRSCYRNTGRRTDKGMWPNILQRRAEEIRNTRKLRKSGIQESVGVWFCWTLIIKRNDCILSVLVAFFGQVFLNWVGCIIMCVRESWGGGSEMITCWKKWWRR